MTSRKDFFHRLPDGFWHGVGAVVFAFLLVFARGYQFGINNVNLFLPLEAKLGHTLLAADFNVGSYEPYHPNFTAGCVLLGKFIDLPALFLAGYFLSAIAFYAAFASIARSLFGDRRVAVLALCLIGAWGSRGLERNNFWFSKAFEAYVLAWPMALFAVRELLERRYFRCFFFAAVSAMIHIQIGSGIGLVCGLVLLADRPHLGYRRTGLLTAWAVFCFLPALSSYFPWAGPICSPDNGSFVRFAIFRMPHHVLLDPAAFRTFFLIIVLGGLALRRAVKERRMSDDRFFVHAQAFRICAAVALLCLAHYYGFYIWQSPIVTKCQFLRLSPLIHAFALIYISKLLLLWAGSANIAVGAFGVFCCFGLFPFWLAGGLPADPSFERVWTLLALLLLAAHRSFKVRWIGPQTLFVLMGAALFLATGVVSACRDKDHLAYDFRRSSKDDWVQLCRWIKEHTGPDERFITPPSESGFSFYSGRSMIAEFKVNPYMDDRIMEWEKRLAALAPGARLDNCRGFDCVPELREHYGRLTPEQVMALSKQYDAGYFIAPSMQKYPFSLLHHKGRFALYSLKKQ